MGTVIPYDVVDIISIIGLLQCSPMSTGDVPITIASIAFQRGKNYGVFENILLWVLCNRFY